MNAFPLLNSPYPILGLFIPFILAAIVWTIVLKGFSLWFSARAGQKAWFIVLLIVNTLGILEIIYLIWFRPKSDELTTKAENAPLHTSSTGSEA